VVTTVEVWVASSGCCPQCMGEGEANGGGDGILHGMAAGPIGAGSGRDQRGIVPNKYSKQLHSKSSAQFYVVRPIHAASAIPAWHKRPFAYMPVQRTNGRKPRRTESAIAIPTQFKSRQKVPTAQRVSRRTRLSHEVLPTLHLTRRCVLRRAGAGLLLLASACAAGWLLVGPEVAVAK
jgi:hypothetical protein